MKNKIKHITIIILAILLCNFTAKAARIKDIASLEGVSGTQVIGYGLVTGLNNTGDNQLSNFTVQSVINMLKRFGLTTPQTNPKIRNVAAVMVTANIPTFSGKGGKIDVLVSSIGDARSLQGGVLLLTPLATADGKIVGMAQGALSVGGYDYQSKGSRISRNFVTSGRVPNGLILETAIQAQTPIGQQIKIIIKDPDFTTANLIAQAINGTPNFANAANVLDGGTVQVNLPAGNIMQSIATIENLQVNPDPVARVVINERTGTVVVGGNVQLLPVVVAHGGIEVSIQKNVVVQQPAPFTIRPPRPVETAEMKAEEQQNEAYTLNVNVPPPTVQTMVNELNKLKLTPRDLIAIFQALKESGALQADLIIQ